ncbi:MAG: rhomboid family intramembrane serine protease [Oscillospiraceae bacterium]|nr:rhomboid family intramembrane serine protease [Oscillospiraceae bacterium]
MKLPKIEVNSPVIIWYAVISFVILLFGYATENHSTMTLFTCYRTNVSDPMMYVRMMTYVFGHKDGTHYMNNFFLITLIGPMLEEKYGGKRLVGMMAITAFVGGVANLLVTDLGLLGASGIAFMMIVLCSCTSVNAGKIPLTLILVVVIYVGQEVVTGVTTKDSVSQLTHILGGLCGVGFGLYYNKYGIPKAPKTSRASKSKT